MLSSTKNSPEGEIHNLKDLKANKSTLCFVFGTYEWVDAHKEKNIESDSESPPENCQAGIRLEDGTMVYLQPTWETSAARSKTELLEYQNKPVVVTGVCLESGVPPEDESAYITGPCMVGPLSITDRKIWDLLHGEELKLD